jgi:hypothetical protein
MRKIIIVSTLLFGLFGHTLAWGQNSGFKPISPKDITYTPINTSKNLAAPIPMPPGGSQPGLFKRMWSHMPSFLGGSKPVMPQVTPSPAMHTKK